jgi:hypothetical protein
MGGAISFAALRASAREGCWGKSGSADDGEVAGVQELQELQNEKIGIVPRALIF